MISIRPAAPVSTLDSPVDHLYACHRRIEERLDTLERVAPHLQTRTADALSAIQSVFWFFDSSGIIHTADEEESVFPRLSPHLTPEEVQLLNDLQSEHLRAEALYDALKQHVANFSAPPTDAESQRYVELAAALCSLYRGHIQAEDSRLPSIAARALSPDDLAAISREMKQRRSS